jgi:predicted nucleic acid-binding protein
MKRHRVILDTNVILAALRSQAGASHRLLMTIGHPQRQSVVTPALMYEYEEVARRPGQVPGLSADDISAILDLLYQRSHRQLVYFAEV